MNIRKNQFYAFLICVISGLILTLILYNLKFKYLITRNILITIVYCILFLLIYFKFKLSSFKTALFSIVTPLLIDTSIFITNKALFPIRFPFATTFLILGVLLGYLLTKNIRFKISGILFTFFYFFLSWQYFIPSLLNNMEDVDIPFNNNFFSGNVLNQNGDTLILKSLISKALIVDLFFVGCSPCERKRKMLEDVENDIQDKRFGVILICDGTVSTFKQFQNYCINNPPKRSFQVVYDYEGNILKYFPDISGYPLELDFGNNKLLKAYSGFSVDGYNLSKKIRIQTVNKILND